MTGRRSVLVAALAVLLFEAVPGLRLTAAQGPAAPASSSSAAAAEQGDEPAVTVRVTAVVRDGRGRPVLDLQPSEFSLDDNGQPQTLTSVELRAVPRDGAATPAPIESAESEAAAAREPATRLFALFLDEFSVAAGEHSARVRDAALAFIEREVRPADLLCVLKPLGAVSSIRCTRDRAAARAAIAAFEGRRGDYEPRSDFERQYFGRTPAAVEGARAQIVTNVLRELTLHIGEMESTRAALVLVTEGLARTPGDRRRLPGWQALARAASHFNLPIYTLDPSTPDPAADAANDQPTGPGGGERSLTAATLAAQTGGESFNGPDLRSAFERIGRDLDAYYVLTYTPSAPTDGRFHPIVVRATRASAVVRAPTGYWSPLSREWRTWLNRPAGPAFTMPTRPLRRSPLIDVWYGFERAADGVMRMVVTWQPASTVAARPRAPQPALVALKAGTAETPAAFETELRAASAAAEEDAGASRAVFPVSPGRVQLDLQVTAMDGTVLDTAAQDVEVPALRGNGPVILQPQIVRARTSRDVARLAGAAEVSPSPSRVFRRTERLLIRVPAYALDDSPVAVKAALLNTRGQKIRDIDLLPRDSASGAAQFDLPLAFLPPGDYGLEFTASGAAGTVRQLLRFELTG